MSTEAYRSRGYIQSGTNVTVAFEADRDNPAPCILLLGVASTDVSDDQLKQTTISPGTSGRVSVEASGGNALHVRVKFGGQSGRGTLRVLENGDVKADDDGPHEEAISGDTFWRYAIYTT